MLWILKLSLLSLPADQRPSGCFRILVRRLSPPGGNSRKKGLGPASPWWPGQAMFILKTHDQNHELLDSNKKRGRITGHIWSVQHVSWMQGREGVQSWFIRLMSFVQNHEKNLVIVLEKLFSYFFTFLEMIEKEKKVYHSVIGLFSHPIGR